MAWNDSIGATGGGVSAYFSISFYQTGVSTIASRTYRNTSDLALPSVNAAVYEGDEGGWIPSHLVESLFTTTIDDFNQPGHGTRYAPVEPATIPASLAPYVNGILAR